MANMRITQPVITVSAPSIPGASPSVYPVRTLRQARQMARAYQHRADLRSCDVRIDRDGRLVEYAGPCGRG